MTISVEGIMPRGVARYIATPTEGKAYGTLITMEYIDTTGPTCSGSRGLLATYTRLLVAGTTEAV